MLVYCDKKTQKSSLSRLTCIKGNHCSSYRRTCSCSKNIRTYVIWHKKAHEITLRYPRVVGSCSMRMRTGKDCRRHVLLGCMYTICFIYRFGTKRNDLDVCLQVKTRDPNINRAQYRKKKMDMLISNHRFLLYSLLRCNTVSYPSDRLITC